MASGKSFYIVVDGIDGAGKSTLIRGLCDAIAARSIEVITCAEPTQGLHGRKIRQHLSPDAPNLSPEQWQELFEADRRENIDQCVRPALERGCWVVQDRCFYSTAAYQGAQGLQVDEILRRNREFAPEPDLLLILDIDPNQGVQRIRSKRSMETDSFERVDYLEKVREIFRSFSGPNILHLDASTTAQELLAKALASVQQRSGTVLG